MFLLRCVIYAKGKKTVANSVYANAWFTINEPLKILPRYFQYFHSSNFKMLFDNKILEKKLPFFSNYIKSITLQNFTFWQPMAIWKRPLNNSGYLQKILFFVCSVYVNCRLNCKLFLTFPGSGICTNHWLMITNQSHIIYQFTKNGL